MRFLARQLLQESFWSHRYVYGTRTLSGAKDTATQPYAPITLPPYPSRLTLPPIPKHRSGMLPWMVLLNPLISRVCYIWRVLSITAQYPSVKEQITHVTGDNIVPAYASGANIKCWGRNPIRTLNMRSPQDLPRDGRHGYSTLLQMGSTNWCALVSSCLDTILVVLSFGFRRKKMVTVSLHKCEEQMQQSPGVWVMFTALTLNGLWNYFVRLFK